MADEPHAGSGPPTPAVDAAHLVQLGIRAEPWDVVTSARARARMLAGRLPAGSRVLMIQRAGGTLRAGKGPQ